MFREAIGDMSRNQLQALVDEGTDHSGVKKRQEQTLRRFDASFEICYFCTPW